MGLKNISDEKVIIKYNGIERDLEPGDVVDVRDFNIQNSEVNSVESLLLEKHVGADQKKKLEQIKTLSNMSDKQINAEIARLEEVIQEMKDEAKPREDQLIEATKQVADLTAKVEASAATIEQYEALLTELDPKWKKALAKSKA